MSVNNKIRDEKLSYNFNRGAAKFQYYHQVKLINISILQVKKYRHLIKVRL